MERKHGEREPEAMLASYSPRNQFPPLFFSNETPSISAHCVLVQSEVDGDPLKNSPRCYLLAKKARTNMIRYLTLAIHKKITDFVKSITLLSLPSIPVLALTATHAISSTLLFVLNQTVTGTIQ